MKQEETDIQRFMQIREEIHAEIEKIEPSVALLQDTAKKVTAHFEVFQKLSQNAQEQIKSTIKAASFELAELAAEQFYSKIEDQIQNEILMLSESVQNARKALGNIERTNKAKNILIAVLGALVMLMGSFGAGYFYNKKATYSLSKEVLETYGLGANFQKVWPKLGAKEKSTVEKLMFKK